MYVHPILILFLASLLAHNFTAQPPTEPTLIFISYDDAAASVLYQENHETLFKDLQDHATTFASYNTSVGSGTDKVHGQYYCRGDIDSRLCGKCIQVASQDSLSVRDNLDMLFIYEECTVHTAGNWSMSGMNVAQYFAFSNSSKDTVLDSEKFDSVFKSTMKRLISKATYDSFATGEGVVSSSETVYCLVQCSPDLNGTQCESCLQSAYGDIPGFKGKWAQWAKVFYSTCQLRYSNEGAFYTLSNDSNVLPPESTPSPEIPPAPVVSPKGKKASYYVIRAVIPAAVVASLIILGVSVYMIKRKIMLPRSSQRQSAVQKPTTEKTKDAEAAETNVNTPECQQFDLNTIETATNSFSLTNKLGQGGFGIVYQGILEDGQDIAVKRLSKNSGQGIKEFKTEVAVVAKLQHKNLVQLVGCCVEREERLLVYEFVRNLSLDRFLFDVTKSTYMTWAIRHKIIQGIARGLRYLHEDSRLKIVHRDLKISNILLDDNLEPKIADFGLAKLVTVDQTSDNTTKVVGTYGYMSPEYALAGRYSTKSDVYSFGVIVLEILSGKINSRFYEISHGEGLLSYAWRVWNERTIEKLMDPVLQNSYSRTEAERCLQMGLLCVQDDEANRPPMHAVLAMLISNTIDLPLPLSPSHSSYINKLSSWDETQEGTSKQLDNESSISLDTLSAQKDLNAR